MKDNWYSNKHIEAVLLKMPKSNMTHLADKLNKEHIKKVVEQPVEIGLKHLADSYKK